MIENRPELYVDRAAACTTEQIHTARMAVCAHSADADEAAELMMMIGIHPGSEDVL